MSEQSQNQELIEQAQDMVRRLQALLKDSELALRDRIMNPAGDGEVPEGASLAQESADSNDGDAD